MSEQTPYSPEQAQAQAAVRALPRVKANVAFRNRLRQEFVSGRLEAPADAPGDQLRRRRMVWAWAGMALVAAVLAWVLLVPTTPAPVWQLADLLATGPLTINGRTVQLEEIDAARLDLAPGTRVGRPDSTMVSLVAGDLLTIQFTPFSEVVLPHTAERWFGRQIRAEVTAGEIHFTTGPGFEGERLLVDTHVARVEVLGSTIAVIHSEDATCVCVYEGTVRIGPLGGELDLVPPGMRKIEYEDNRPPVLEEITGMERMKLQMLKDAAFPGP